MVFDSLRRWDTTIKGTGDMERGSVVAGSVHDGASFGVRSTGIVRRGAEEELVKYSNVRDSMV